ncbi:hypothetical protein LUZ60_012760 [Juncus effusus]|nr:hypothetical protein LUZ60_012760 [Juncus effusus]
MKEKPHFKVSYAFAVKCLLFVVAIFSVLNPAMFPQFIANLGEPDKSSPVEEKQNLGGDARVAQLLVKLIEEQSQNESAIGITNKKGSLVCDSSHYSFDVCSLEGDIRVFGSSASVLLIPPSSSIQSEINNTVYKIRPFTRKWEDVTMSRIREFTVQQTLESNQAPACNMSHDVPVLIFSTEGFPFNVFHDYTDLLIPLFMAAYQYNRKIQLAATNFHVRWIEKFQPFLTSLSRYPIINLDSETIVHCFPSGQVGLRSHGPLHIDPSISPNGYTIQDFRHFVRTSLSLERSQVEIVDKNSSKKPRLAILLRKGTRAFTNEKEIVEMVEQVGFEAVPIDTETTKEFPRIAHVVNSCDVLIGLHGAGLTNMIYLPTNGTVIQILPFGDLKFIGWKDYGEPTKDMGIKYVEYEIKEEESSLIEKYPKDHAVFTNPQEIHKQGWNVMYNIYLVEQNVKLDVHRFSRVLDDIYTSLTQ